jgi:hypothetical protein
MTPRQGPPSQPPDNHLHLLHTGPMENGEFVRKTGGLSREGRRRVELAVGRATR